ncbi:MAG TPA: HAMP domain-containing protein, partial [Myxococcota bacterium]
MSEPPPRDLEDSTVTAREIEAPVKRRVSRRLALVAGISALVLGGVAFALLSPIERAAVERVASEQVGLLAEGVAATYSAPVAQAPDGGAALDGDSDDGIEREHAARTHHEPAHRAAEILEQLKHAENITYIDVLDHDGHVKQSTRPERIGATRAVPRTLRQAELVDDQLVVSYAMPFTHACAQCHDEKADPVGVVQVAVDREIALHSLERFQLFYVASVFLAFAVLVIIIVVLTERTVARPVFKLARLMKKAERGDFLVRARVEGDDELGALARAFNSMLRAITTLKAHEIEREIALKSAEAELTIKSQLQDVAERLQLSNAALQRRVQAQGLLMEAAHRLGSTLDKTALVERLARVVADNLGRPDFAVYLVKEAEDGEAV